MVKSPQNDGDEYESEAESEAEITSKKRTKDTKDIKPNKKSRNDLYKQPTAEEISSLRETEHLFSSNIVRMQINALLDEVKVQPNYIAEIDIWIKEFTQIVNAWKIQPSKIQLIGPQGLHLTNIPTESVKFTGIVLLTMPKSLFLVKDYLDYRYTTKKETYLKELKRHLKKHLEIVQKVRVEQYLGNPHIQYMVITPMFSQDVRINMFLVPEEETFKVTRFLPDRNNLKTFTDDAFPEFNVGDFAEKKVGTLYYNATQLFDVTLKANLNYLHDLFAPHAHIRDAITLICIWLRQRHLNASYTDFTDDLVLYLIGYLFNNKKINKLMSSYQVIRTFWLFLSTHKNEKLSLKDIEVPMTLFVQNLVLLDVSGCYNTATFLDTNVWSKVRQEAKYAVDALDNSTFDMFSQLFTTPMPVALQYDAILKVLDLNNFRKIYWNTSADERFAYFGHYKLLIQHQIESKLKYGLSNRVSEILQISSSTGESNTIMFGINLNPENCYNVIEKGPQQFDQAAAEFKEFWGSLVDLRRFKDSSVYEAVYFENVKTIQDKRLLFTKIVDFVMTEKLELNYELHGVELESMLKFNNLEHPLLNGSNEEACLRIKAVQMDLDKILRNLKLPLPITGMQCTSDLNCYAEPFPPVAANYDWRQRKCIEQGDHVVFVGEIETRTFRVVPHYIPPIHCVLQLAMNSKWPNELQAFRAMKTIFFFEISKLIRIEHDLVSIVRHNFIDVFCQGYVFRLHLHHPKEIGLVKKDVNQLGVTFYKSTEESLRLERDFDVLPKLAGALNGFHQEHPAYGPSTCLIKRWLRSQLLDAHHISDIVINLLNASLFINARRSPVLPQRAFLNFLKFISDFDYNFRMIVVNFNDVLNKEQLNEIDVKFLQTRQTFNTLHIVTPFDDGKSVFTKEAPSPLVMNRIKSLAKASYDGLVKGYHETEEFLFRPYFVPNLIGYDLLIHLNLGTNSTKHQQVNYVRKNCLSLQIFDNQKSKSIPVVDFHPVQYYLADLRENYGDYALFFHDSYGGNVIGVLWKRNMLDEQEFRISAVHGRKLSSAENCRLKLDIEALIEDFYIHGKGVVHSIEILQEK